MIRGMFGVIQNKRKVILLNSKSLLKHALTIISNNYVQCTKWIIIVLFSSPCLLDIFDAQMESRNDRDTSEYVTTPGIRFVILSLQQYRPSSHAQTSTSSSLVVSCKIHINDVAALLIVPLARCYSSVYDLAASSSPCELDDAYQHLLWMLFLNVGRK